MQLDLKLKLPTRNTVFTAAWLNEHPGVFQSLLKESYGKRVVCMCGAHRPELVIKRYGDNYILARMPNTANLHEAHCPLYDEREQSLMMAKNGRAQRPKEKRPASVHHKKTRECETEELVSVLRGSGLGSGDLQAKQDRVTQCINAYKKETDVRIQVCSQPVNSREGLGSLGYDAVVGYLDKLEKAKFDYRVLLKGFRNPIYISEAARNDYVASIRTARKERWSGFVFIVLRQHKGKYDYVEKMHLL